MGDVKTPQITLHVHIIVLDVTFISRVKLILDGLKSILKEYSNVVVLQRGMPKTLNQLYNEHG